ncbi:MAG: ABC transporter ATP-binding protein [Streptosporangiaceae bacterium]
MNSATTARPPGTDPRAKAAPLEFRRATKHYEGQPEPAVRELSLTVPAGDICVLVGPSGCGKTTAMRMVNRLIDISGGDILLDEQSVRERDPADLRREIGYVIQQVGLFPHLTIGANIATVPKLLGWGKRRIADRVDELLTLTGLDPGTYRDRYPKQLSGGQQQRVGVARALGADPSVMLMDEPFGAIDPINRDRLQNEFLRLQAEIRKTVVFVTHDIDEAIKMGDHIAILREGGVLAQYDTPEAILTRPADDFVARFVGADRGLKRLTLSRLSDLDLIEAHCVTEAAAQGAGDDARTVVVDEGGHPVGRPRPTGHGARDDRQPPGGSAHEDAREVTALGPVARIDTSLRDALSLVLSDPERALVVVGDEGRVAGLASVDLIGSALVRFHAAPTGDDGASGHRRPDPSPGQPSVTSP